MMLAWLLVDDWEMLDVVCIVYGFAVMLAVDGVLWCSCYDVVVVLWWCICACFCGYSGVWCGAGWLELKWIGMLHNNYFCICPPSALIANVWHTHLPTQCAPTCTINSCLLFSSFLPFLSHIYSPIQSILLSLSSIGLVLLSPLFCSVLSALLHTYTYRRVTEDTELLLPTDILTRLTEESKAASQNSNSSKFQNFRIPKIVLCWW